MGGLAFNACVPPVVVPRMPRDIYAKVLDQTLMLLKKHYKFCASPTEGPGKATFGDIDILVASPLSEAYDPFLQDKPIFTKRVAEHLKGLLGSDLFIATPGNPTINFAIPWPNEESQSTGQDKFIQLDVHHLPSKERFDWELFHSAHSDLWNILGSTIRPFGLTANDTGLYLRITEIETLDKKKSLVYLTSSPKDVLDFLGLDHSMWWNEFKSEDEMFRYAAKNRMFWVREEDESLGEGDVVVKGESELLAQEGGDAGKKKLKHNDRQRMAKRPIFRAWINDFIPVLRKEGGPRAPTVTREQVRDEALEKFGVREIYETRLKEWQLARHLEELKRDIIKGEIPLVENIPVPDGASFRSAAVRMLTDVIMGGEKFDGKSPPAARKTEQGFYDIELVRDFVRKNWRRAGELGLERQRARANEAMKAKGEKKRKDAEELEQQVDVDITSG